MNVRLVVVGVGEDEDEEFCLDKWNGTQEFKYTKWPQL